MKKTSKKTLKRADKKSVSYRLTSDQLLQAEGDLWLENESRGAFPVSLTAYAKQSLLEHQRRRRLEIGLRELVTNDAIGVVDFDELTRKVLNAYDGGSGTETEGSFDRTRAMLIE